MYKLPLYGQDHRVAAEKADPKRFNPHCNDCVLGEGPKNPCLGPMITSRPTGKTLLVITDWPTAVEDDRGAFMNSTNLWIRKAVEPLWEGTVVYTHGIRCAVSRSEKDDPPDAAFTACRGYLRTTLDAVRPARILIIGKSAGIALLDRAVHAPWVRGGYAYLSSGAVAYWMPEPSRAITNDLYGRDWLEDARHALQDPLPQAPPWDAVALRIETPEDARQAAKRIKEHGAMAYDVEHSGGMYTRFFEVDCVGVNLTGTDDTYVWGRKALNDPECAAILRDLIEDDSIEKGAHNAKVECESCAEDARIAAAIPVRMVDTLVTRKIGHPLVNAYLEDVAELVGMGGHKEEMEAAVKEAVEVIEHTREEWRDGRRHIPGTLPRLLEAALAYPAMDPRSLAYGAVCDDMRDTYVALDALTTGRAVPRVRQDVQLPGLARVCEEMSAVPRAVSHLERAGILVDRNQILMVASHAEKETKRLSMQLEADGLREPSKPDQVIEYLYGKHGLTPGGFSRKTGKPSVDKNALAKLPKDHPAVKLYSSWKTLETVRTRYGGNLLDFIRDDGRIHGYYNSNGTKTGRWSANDPNFQNQPSRGDLAKMVKRIYVAPPGKLFLQTDFSQLEYRVAAWISGDKNWTKAFQEGKDLHRQNAELASFAWGIPREVAMAMTDVEMEPYRYKAKAVGFGLLYGKATFSLAKEWGVSLEEAQAVVDAIMGNSPEVAAWIESQHRFAYANGYVNTVIDGKPARWLPIYEARSMDEAERRQGARRAVNAPIQGSAADFMMRSLVATVDWLEGDHIPASIVATVHDSMLIEVEDAWAEDVARTTLSIMEQWDMGPVPLKADLEVGRSWGTLKKAKFMDGTLMFKDGDLWKPLSCLV